MNKPARRRGAAKSRRRVFTLTALTLGLLALGLLLIIALVLSPRAVDTIAQVIKPRTEVNAIPLNCRLLRDGHRRRDAISCDFVYRHAGQVYERPAVVWFSKSPFASPARLDAMLTRAADRADSVWIDERRPGSPRVRDGRWLMPPTLWLWLGAGWIALVFVVLKAQTSASVHRRGDYRRDRAHDQLVPLNRSPAQRQRRYALLLGALALYTLAITAINVSQKLENDVQMLGMRSLTPVTATLQDCGLRYIGTTRGGHHQVRCNGLYRYDGVTYLRQADALNLALPTRRATRETFVDELQGAQVTAYVDPRHPGYARMPLNDDWLLPLSWSLLTILIALAALPLVPWWLVCAWRHWAAARRLT